MGAASRSRYILFDRQKIPISYLRRTRKTLAIHVSPAAVEVRVPHKCAWLEIDRFVQSRTTWILASLAKLSELETQQISFLDGSTVPYLGRDYQLRIYAGRSKVALAGDFFMVRSMAGNDPRLTRQLIDRFYRQQCLPVFQARLDVCSTQFPLDLKPSGLKVRKMSARWGSCSPAGVICLNTQLMRYDVDIIDFVINHELCHLKHFNHSNEFYLLMDLVMPHWRSLEKQMNTMAY